MLGSLSQICDSFCMNVLISLGIATAFLHRIWLLIPEGADEIVLSLSVCIRYLVHLLA